MKKIYSWICCISHFCVQSVKGMYVVVGEDLNIKEIRNRVVTVTKKIKMKNEERCKAKSGYLHKQFCKADLGLP